MAEPSRIIIVDDEERLLDGLRRSLRPINNDWRLSFQTSALAALDAARAQTPDVVVTDLRMPEMSGFELIAAMRGVAPHARYLILTGTGDFETALSAINHVRAFRFLTKPCPASALSGAIANALADRASVGAVASVPSINAQAGLGALSVLPSPVIVVTVHDASVLFANAAGQDLLRARDGLLCDECGHLRAAEPRQTARLHEAIAYAHDRGGDFAAIARPSMQAELSVAIAPIPSEDGEAPSVALLITDPEQQSAPDPQALGKLFDLSATEARIALAIAQGYDVGEAAALAGVTLSTARTYLKRAFAKTGARRQAELVKLVLSAPALRMSGDAERRSNAVG